MISKEIINPLYGLLLIGVLLGILNSLQANTGFARPLFSIDSLPPVDSSEEIKNKKTVFDPLVLKYADKLQADPAAIDQPLTWAWVEEWLGIRYVWGGNSKKGIDCSALTERMLEELYQQKSSRLVVGQFNKCQLIDSSELTLGDLIFFKTHNKRKGLTHVAFSLGGRYFIHASSSRGVVIDHLDKNYYRKTYRYSGRILPPKNDASLPPA